MSAGGWFSFTPVVWVTGMVASVDVAMAGEIVRHPNTQIPKHPKNDPPSLRFGAAGEVPKPEGWVFAFMAGAV
tara:strand:- start:308 stop:526 length:219 start_codon:yes stop_codon:yes gene_type:complete